MTKRKPKATDTQKLPAIKLTGRHGIDLAEPRNTPITHADIPRLSLWQMIRAYFTL